MRIHNFKMFIQSFLYSCKNILLIYRANTDRVLIGIKHSKGKLVSKSTLYLSNEDKIER